MICMICLIRYITTILPTLYNFKINIYLGIIHIILHLRLGGIDSHWVNIHSVSQLPFLYLCLKVF